MKQTVWFIYARPTPYKKYEPAVNDADDRDGSFWIYKTEKAALDACDVDSEIVVKGYINYRKISDVTAERIKNLQYARMKKNFDDLSNCELLAGGHVKRKKI